MSPRMSWIFFASASLPLGRAREGSIKGAPPRGIDPGPHDSSSLCPMPPPPPLGSRSRFQSLFHVRRRVRRRAAISPPVRVVRRGFNNEPRGPDLVSHTPFLSAEKENRTRGRVVQGCNRLQALASWILTMDISGRRNIGALPTFTTRLRGVGRIEKTRRDFVVPPRFGSKGIGLQARIFSCVHVLASRLLLIEGGKRKGSGANYRGR